MLIPAFAFGATLLGLGLVLLGKELLRPLPASPARQTAVGLLVFSIGVAAASAWGRVDVDPAVTVPVRYSVLVAPLHIGILVLLAPSLQGLGDRLGWARLVPGVFAGLALGVFALQLAAFPNAIHESRAISDALERFRRHIRDPGVERYVGSGPLADQVFSSIGASGSERK